MVPHAIFASTCFIRTAFIALIACFFVNPGNALADPESCSGVNERVCNVRVTSGEATNQGGSNHYVRISWDDNPNCTSGNPCRGFALYRSEVINPSSTPSIPTIVNDLDNVSGWELLWQTISTGSKVYIDDDSPVPGPGARHVYHVCSVNENFNAICEAIDFGHGWRQAPMPPSNMHVNFQNDSYIQLDWTGSPTYAAADESSSGVSPAMRYELYRNETGAACSGVRFDVAGNQTQFNDTSALPGRTYFYSVRAVSVSNVSFASSCTATTVVTREVSPPDNVSADGVEPNIINVSWDAPTNNIGLTYNLYRSTSSSADCSGTPIATDLSVTSYTDSLENGTGLLPDINYYYTLRSVSSTGAQSECSSNSSGEQIHGYDVRGNVYRENSTTGIQGATVSIGSQTDGTDTTGRYELRELLSGFVTVSASPPPGSGIIITNSSQSMNIIPGQDGYQTGPTFYARCPNDQQFSGNTCVDIPPGGISFLQASDGTSTSSISINWASASGTVSGYRLYRNGSCSGSVYQNNLIGTSYTDTNVTPGTVYTYSVRAFNAGGNGPCSPSDTGFAQVSAPNPPASVNASDGTSASNISINWSAASGNGTITYDLYRSDDGASCSGSPIQQNLSGLSYTDAAPTPGKSYFYSLRARNDGGQSSCSNVDSGYRALGITSGVSAEAASSSSALVSWNALQDASSYLVYESNDCSGSATTVFDSTSTTITGLSLGTHFFSVKARGINGLLAPATPCSSATSVTIENFSISGQVLQQDGTTGLANVLISLNTGESTTSDANGQYVLANIPDGTYAVTATLAGYTFTNNPRTNVQVAGGDVTVDFQAINAPFIHTLGGTVTRVNGLPLANVEVMLEIFIGSNYVSQGAFTTQTNGEYSFQNLGDGDYRVTPVLTGYTFSPAERLVTINGADALNNDFQATASPAIHSLSGSISEFGTDVPASNIDVVIEYRETLSDSYQTLTTVTTNSSGDYQASNLEDGYYRVTPESSLLSFSPANYEDEEISGASVNGLNFTASTGPAIYSITGAVYLGDGTTALTGTALRLERQLLDGTFVELSSINNVANGSYQFTALANGNYRVTAERAGYTFSPPLYNVTIDDANVSDRDFTVSAGPSNYVVSGIVLQAAGVTGLAGTTVTLTGGGTPLSQVTTASGTFSFTGLSDGNYVVTPSHGFAYSFTPTEATVLIAGANPSPITFVANAAAVHSISGVVMNPLLGQPAEGVVVNAGAGLTAVTAADGTYTIANLQNGSYTLTASTSNASVVPNGFTNPLTINGANQVANFNVAPNLDVSGSVLLPGDTPLANVSVTISGSGISPVSALTATDGSYTVSVPAGVYTLNASRAGYTISPANFSNDITVSANQSGLNFRAISELRFSVSGLVSRASGAPVPAVTITAEATGFGVTQAQSETNGQYSISNLPQGNYTLSGARPDYVITADFSNPVNVANVNVGNRDFSAECAPGTIEFEGVCLTEDDPPATPTNLSASDGTSDDFVTVTWSPAAGALRYTLYRSQFDDDIGSPVQENGVDVEISETSYNDQGAVPGVFYYYTVQAVNPFGVSGFSNTDQGYRRDPSGIADCDGDGVSDAQEIIDGTGVCDPGSFQLHLKSPAFTKYNTFLNQFNFLELTASGTETIEAEVIVYSIGGEMISTKEYSIPAGQQQDVDIHSDIIPLAPNGTYGVVQINFNDETPGANLIGRMSNYRLNPDGQSYSFAFAKELRNPTQGVTFASSNSIDPQGRGFLVPNWLELINLDSVPREFTYKIYNQSGELLETNTETVPPLGEIDRQAGHEFDQGVFVLEIIPTDGATKYFATVTRYSSNSSNAGNDGSFNFAFPVDSKAGNGDQQYVSTSNEASTCWTQSNWIEVTNVRDRSVVASIEFRDSSGAIRGTSSVELSPKEQFHFNAAAMLEKGDSGSARIIADAVGSLVVQAAYYFHDIGSNLNQTAYVIPARIPGQDVQRGGFNTFLNIQNVVRVVSTIDEPTSYELALRSQTGFFSEQVQEIGTSSVGALNLSEQSTFGIADDTVGTVTLRSLAGPQRFLGESIRFRESGCKMDFVIPTLIQ